MTQYVQRFTWNYCFESSWNDHHSLSKHSMSKSFSPHSKGRAYFSKFNFWSYAFVNASQAALPCHCIGEVRCAHEKKQIWEKSVYIFFLFPGFKHTFELSVFMLSCLYAVISLLAFSIIYHHTHYNVSLTLVLRYRKNLLFPM